MKKYLKIIRILVIAVLIVSGCTANPDSELSNEEIKDTDGTIKSYTVDELAEYNGKDGNPAYVAVNGIIYDVTDVEAWTGGTHNGNMEGKDVTDAITKAPHGESTLKDLEIVGELVD